MAKFKFPMATLLRLREATRAQRRAELGEAYRVGDVLQQQIDQVAGELRRLQADYRAAAGPGTVDVDRLVEVQRCELALRAHGKRLQHQRETVDAEIERRRQVLVEANREVRVLEKLREKQADRHRREEGRKEIKQLDEAAARCGLREDVP
jgi:flagellar FliJ protein